MTPNARIPAGGGADMAAGFDAARRRPAARSTPTLDGAGRAVARIIPIDGGTGTS